MSYDIEKLKRDVKEIAALTRDSSAQRAAILQKEEDLRKREFPDYRARWAAWESIHKEWGALRRIPERATLLYSIRAHLRGRLHCRRKKIFGYHAEKAPNGWYVADQTMEDQAKYIEKALQAYVLGDQHQSIG
jgi:hypothetical protein